MRNKNRKEKTKRGFITRNYDIYPVSTNFVKDIENEKEKWYIMREVIGNIIVSLTEN